MSTEPILDESNSRFTMYPIQYQGLWDLYQKQLSSFWKPQEIDFSKDYEDFVELSADEQHYIKRVLAFFAASDGIVNFNLSKRFLQEIKIMEAITCYTYQMMIEGIHSETYSLMLDNLIKDSAEKDFLFQSIKTVESVKKLGDWAMHWIESDLSFAHRVVAFAVVEGIFFSGAFASIFWLKRYKSNGRLFLQGLVKSNEFIARDEGMHVQFACEIYKLLETKLSKEAVFEIIDDGVKVAKIFMKDALPIRLLGMNSESMEQYIECVADRLSMDLGYKKMYNTPNPFVFMETIGMLGKSNFFESRPTDYQSAFNQDNKRTTNLETFEDDF
ncbi:ribonucleoside-diphosphate reductase [bacterium]|nr:ribonucleoside-diphosphate reductase [bacterium]